MRERCRVTEELNAEMRRIDKLEQQQAKIDALAGDIYDQATGYGKGYDISCFTDSLIAYKDKRLDYEELAEVFCEYLARKFARIEPGIADDRQIIANEYLLAKIREWADDQAMLDFRED